MRREIKIYIASKLEHAAKLAALRKDGFHINARWIDTAPIGQQKLKPVTHWQQENFDDIEMADFVILYVEPGDKLKGALVELGVAIRAGKEIWIAGDGHGVEVSVESDLGAFRLPHRDILPWSLYAQSIRVAASLDEAFSQIKARVFPEKKLDNEGKGSP